MQTVCQLDDDDADVAAHGHEHLAKRANLCLAQGLDLDLVDLRDAVDEFGNRRVEAFGQVVQGDVGIFDRVVQKRRAQRVDIHVQLGEDDGDFHRVHDVGFAALAELPVVRFLGKLVRIRDRSHLVWIQVFGDLVEQDVEAIRLLGLAHALVNAGYMLFLRAHEKTPQALRIKLHGRILAQTGEIRAVT